ncbi:flagellar hook-basal body complex protein [Metabacillus fastidiosus]|uniref:flagellar hook protein FlgE n=1 Tax=Metabacillus fastidiosus TaxID=1458 RepID=UPI002E1C88C8|nr:flagellar hook-basal body complex protein [Metabacillus fastidiosus]
MLRSMYAGISGMKNFQTKLDVIGNNIANVNTYGFKKGRVTFKDMISQQIAGAAAATTNRGGINAQQIGLGSQVSSIDTIHTTGATQTTARTLDLALAGDGFFPVATISDIARIGIDRGNEMGNNKITGSIDRAVNLNYTRAGNFYLDDRGYLVTGDGMFIIGETGEKSIPTDAAKTKGNAAVSVITTFEGQYKTISDGLSNFTKKANSLLTAFQNYDDAYKVLQASANPADTNSKEYKAMDNAQKALKTVYDDFKTTADTFKTTISNFNTAITPLNTGINTFNTTAPISDIISQVSTLTDKLTVQGTDYPGATGAVATTNTALTTEVDTMKTLVNEVSNFKLELDKIGQGVVQFETAAEDLYKPQWTQGLSGEAGLIQIPLDAQSFSIGPDGTVIFINSRGERNVAGQIRIANFANAGGLEKIGANLFRESANSGSVDRNNNGIQLDELFAPGSDGAATIVAGSLEMSNVDLSEEFTEMIVAQRGFQSNTKIITTSDEILQELMGLKR